MKFYPPALYSHILKPIKYHLFSSIPNGSILREYICSLSPLLDIKTMYYSLIFRGKFDTIITFAFPSYLNLMAYKNMISFLISGDFIWNRLSVIIHTSS
jgi:hypothetical protein